MKLPPDAYSVGWICAILPEFVAAETFLDEKHDRVELNSPNDSNTYLLGRMCGHNVVIAVLPNGKYGLSSATGVASDMLHSFPNVKIGLMVGIGGGAPGLENDIRLGDVVVSSPSSNHGGVFQYDFGKSIQDRKFQEASHLNAPPIVLRTAVMATQAAHEGSGNSILKDVNSRLDSNKRLKSKYKKPDLFTDRLYEASNCHPEGNQKDCIETCGTGIEREPRTEDDDDPVVHYGLIGSSNQLMKNAMIRDRLSKERGILCFEMEAAGLMDRFPCLVIRGICDYSDTHKNKKWQGYAAMTAAAYAKDLLSRIVPKNVEHLDKITLDSCEYKPLGKLSYAC